MWEVYSLGRELRFFNASPVAMQVANVFSRTFLPGKVPKLVSEGRKSVQFVRLF